MMLLQKTLAIAAITTGQLTAQGLPSNEIHQSEQRIDAVQKDVFKDIRTLATVDIGSGSTKVTVADVDRLSNQIEKIWFQKVVTVPLRKDLIATGGRLSPEIEQTLIDTIKGVMLEAAEYNPERWLGVGTSVFRTASNSQEFLERVRRATGLEVRIVPQVDEGEIGFASAVGASGLTPEQVIAWDSGSGSFQITTLIDGKLEMYGSEFGFVPALELLCKLRDKPVNEYVNPVGYSEAIALVDLVKASLVPVKPWVSDANKVVAGVGESRSVFSICSIATGRDTYNKQDLLQAIAEHCGKSDAELSQFLAPHEAVIGLVLVYAVMDHCGIEECRYVSANGGCEGLMVLPKYWVE